MAVQIFHLWLALITFYQHIHTPESVSSITADVDIQVDDSYTASVSYDAGLTFQTLSSNSAWHTVFSFSIPNITPDTVLEIEGTDYVGGGWFIAQINFNDGTEYYPTNPLSNSNFEMVGVSEPTYIANPNTNVFNNNAAAISFGGTKTFRFSFATIAIPGIPPPVDVSLQVDDVYTASVSYDSGSNFQAVSSNGAWHTVFAFTINVTPQTILEVECTDHVGGGFFIAQINFFDGTQYYTTNPLSNSNFEMVGVSNPTYGENKNTNVFNNNARSITFGGTQTFRFNFANIAIPSVTTRTPTPAPTNLPTPAPTNLPTPAPINVPTGSPTYKVCNLEELQWDKLNAGNLTELSAPFITSSWDAETLQFDIDITLDYVTRSKYTFMDQYDNDRGITYVIDTEAFLSDGRLISNPNNCENRESTSFTGKDWTNEYWSYLNQGNGLNSIDYLEYGPSNIWTLNWDIECETITYSNTFSVNQLLGCTDKDSANTFTFIEDDEWLNLTGSFYITLVSPLINQNDVVQSATDIGQYLTNTIGNYPISISFPKKIASIRDPGVQLFDISIFAIQYDEQNSKLLVDILSYTAEYINLINVNVMIPIVGYDTNGAVNSIIINEDDSYSTTECLFETNFRCFQKFQIEIDLSSCPLTSIDLSTTILLDVEPACRNGEDCTLFRSEFGAVGTTTQLTESLSYTESCDTQIYIQTFEGTIKYFIDMGFTNEVDETTEFSIGSTLYVDVSVNDIGAYGVFSIDVFNVWICTTSATDLSITSQLTGEGGCIQNYGSNNGQASNIDEIYQAFKDRSAYDSKLNGQTYLSLNDESVRFSLIIPSFQRNKFWLHAIVEMTLENNVRRRARLLLTTSNNLDGNSDDGNTVNRLSHYIKDVSIVNDNIKTTDSISNTEKEETNSSVSYYYSYFMCTICIFIIALC